MFKNSVGWSSIVLVELTIKMKSSGMSGMFNNFYTHFPMIYTNSKTYQMFVISGEDNKLKTFLFSGLILDNDIC